MNRKTVGFRLWKWLRLFFYMREALQEEVYNVAFREFADNTTSLMLLPQIKSLKGKL